MRQGGTIAFSDCFPADTLQSETRKHYSKGYHGLGAALARAARKNLRTLAREWIGDPLGIAIPAWRRDPQGFYFGGNDMALSPMAMLRFGEMHRLGGLWQGKRVLSEA